MFNDNDSFWSSGMTNGIPTSAYSQYDPEPPRTTNTNTIIKQSGRTLDEWKTFYLIVGIIVFVVGLICVGISVYLIIQKIVPNVENIYENVPFWLWVFFCFSFVVFVVGMFIMGLHKKIAYDSYKEQQENNKATVESNVIDSTTVVRE